MKAIQLSNSRILSNAFLPAVEAKVIKNIPGYAAFTGDDLILLRSAVTKLTAAQAVRASMESEKSLEYSYGRKREDLLKSLLTGAEDDLGTIASVAADIAPSDVFRLSGPTRARKADSEWIYETVVIR